MIHKMLKKFWSVQPISCTSPYFSEWDYISFENKKEALTNQWRSITPEEQKKYDNSINKYYRSELEKEPSAEEKNYSLLSKETELRLAPGSGPKLLCINNDFNNRSALDLLEIIENDKQIKEIYRFKKKNLGSSQNAGLNTIDAKKIKSCLRQGRELFESAQNGAMLIKPLIFFYSLTAYAYALILMNNPIKYRLEMLQNSHGIKYHHRNCQIDFGGEVPFGTFSDLFFSFPAIYYIDGNNQIAQDNRRSIIQFCNAKYSISVGTLLAMIPEIRDYYSLITGENSITYPLQMSWSINGHAVNLELLVGDGKTLPQGINDSFPDFDVSNVDGKHKIIIPRDQFKNIRAQIFPDIKGQYWYIENHVFPVVLPEICVHFLLLNALSNIMRYSPDTWGELLLNESDSNLSLLVRKYIFSFEKKFPILLIQGLTQYHAFYN